MPFATSADLATYTGDDNLDSARGTMLLEQATAIIQAHCRQTLEQVTDDTQTLRGHWGQWLLLPERPVQSVTSVKLDDETVDDFERVRDRLWRRKGWVGDWLWWQRDWGRAWGEGEDHSTVEVVYTHGFAADSPAMETLKAVCLWVAGRMAANPQGFATFSDAAGTNINFRQGGLTAPEQAILDRFKHEQAAKL